jgi:probable HAF family extracellular repeat protein
MSRLPASLLVAAIVITLGASAGRPTGSQAAPSGPEASTPCALQDTAAPAPSVIGASHARYRFTDLGVLGGLDSAARAVSETGVVVGHADVRPGSGLHGFHAFWWPPLAATMVDLGTIGGDQRSAANDVNGVNQIVGASLAADGRTHAFLWDGEMRDLGHLGDERAEANAINDSGQVAGASAPALDSEHAFLWTPAAPNGVVGAMVDLGVLPDHVASYGLDLNGVGQVVGYSNDQDWMSHPFLWAPSEPNGPTGTMQELPDLPDAVSGVAEAINADGWVVGSMEVGSPTATERAFAWRPRERNGSEGSVIDLGTLGGDHSLAFDVNAAGCIVGYAQLPGDGEWPGVDHAFLYRDGVMVDLNDLLVPASPEAELMVAEGIGDDGSIVGTAIVAGHRHAYLLTPVAEG